MKKITKILFTTLTLAITSFSFTSCFNPIFPDIRQEVKLEKATILGQIYSIVRFKDELYLANGRIFSKQVSGEAYGQWNEHSKPSGSVISLAADSNYLYAFVITTKRNETEGEMELDTRKLYVSSDGNNWKIIKTLSSSKNDKVILMSTNSVIPENRKAYYAAGDNLYELNGDTSPVQRKEKKIKSCTSLNGQTKFFEGNAACSNYNDTVAYYSKGANLRKVQKVINEKTGKEEEKDTMVCSNISGEIYGIAITQDAIILNSTSGAVTANLDGTHNKNIYENLYSTLSSNYEGIAVLAAFPNRTAKATPVYASITVRGTGSNSALFTHEGLWAYYPGRGKWNIE